MGRRTDCVTSCSGTAAGPPPLFRLTGMADSYLHSCAARQPRSAGRAATGHTIIFPAQLQNTRHVLPPAMSGTAATRHARGHPGYSQRAVTADSRQTLSLHPSICSLLRLSAVLTRTQSAAVWLLRLESYPVPLGCWMGANHFIL